MGNLWPDFFDDDVVSPKETLEEQASFLPKMTKGLVYAELEPLTTFEKFEEGADSFDFSYSFNIKGSSLDQYKYRAFIICFNISLYPAYIFLNDDIAKEIQFSKKIEITHYDQLLNILEKVFKSPTMLRVVTSIRRLSN